MFNLLRNVNVFAPLQYVSGHPSFDECSPLGLIFRFGKECTELHTKTAIFRSALVYLAVFPERPVRLSTMTSPTDWVNIGHLTPAEMSKRLMEEGWEGRGGAGLQSIPGCSTRDVKDAHLSSIIAAFYGLP